MIYHFIPLHFSAKKKTYSKRFTQYISQNESFFAFPITLTIIAVVLTQEEELHVYKGFSYSNKRIFLLILQKYICGTSTLEVTSIYICQKIYCNNTHQLKRSHDTLLLLGRIASISSSLIMLENTECNFDRNKN